MHYIYMIFFYIYILHIYSYNIETLMRLSHTYYVPRFLHVHLTMPLLLIEVYEHVSWTKKLKIKYRICLYSPDFYYDSDVVKTRGYGKLSDSKQSSLPSYFIIKEFDVHELQKRCTTENRNVRQWEKGCRNTRRRKR